MQRLSGHVRAGRTAEAAHHSRDLERTPFATERDVFRSIGPVFSARSRRIDLTRGYAVHTNTELREILSERFRQPDDTVFRSRDVRAVLQTQQRSHAGEQDDAAVA